MKSEYQKFMLCYPLISGIFDLQFLIGVWQNSVSSKGSSRGRGRKKHEINVFPNGSGGGG